MYNKTTAIVLRFTKHTDKTNILHLYSRTDGRISVLVHGIHGKKSNNKKALFEPLSIIDIETTQRNNTLRLGESKLHIAYKQIPFDIAKRSICMLLAEILENTLQEQIENEELFDFIIDSLLQLDNLNQAGNFHIHFLLQLTSHLGIQPNLEEKGTILDMESGNITCSRPTHKNYIEGNMLEILKLLNHSTYETNESISIKRSERQNLLKAMIDYYRIHIPAFKSPKSIDILTELFESF